MPEVAERLDNVEKRLGSVEGRLESVEGRLGSVEGRLGSVEGQLGSVAHKVDVLDGKVDALGGRVDALGGRMDMLGGRVDILGGRFDTLSGQVHKLHVLHEASDDRIKAIAEVQTRHSERLDEHGRMLERILNGDIKPLKDLSAAVQQIGKDVAKQLRDFLDGLAHEHEARITELEKRAGLRE